jgi:hypothetical protein
MKAIVIAIILLLAISNATATRVLLQDDFEDGSYTDSWTIDWSHTGNPEGDPEQQDFEPQDVKCEGSNCYLRGHTTQDGGHVKNAPVLYTGNPTNVGSWQFDSRLLSTEDDQHNFIVLSTGDKLFKDNLYWVAHRKSGISLEKRIDRTQYTTLISGEGLGDQSDQWYTIKFTRDANGLWNLFVDDALVGEAVDTTFTDLPYLMIGRYGDFDNIVVTASAD